MDKRDLILQAVELLHPITHEAWIDIKPLFTYGELKKGEYFVREGERNDHVAFVLSGVLRGYYENAEGTQYNKTFFPEGSFAMSFASVLQNIPSFLNFDALTDTTFYQANYNKIIALFDKHRCVESMIRKLLEYDWVIKKEQRELRLVMNDATDRYLFFQKEYPGLENLIPQYHIASHLGITPIQLSRIRSALSSKG